LSVPFLFLEVGRACSLQVRIRAPEGITRQIGLPVPDRLHRQECLCNRKAPASEGSRYRAARQARRADSNLVRSGSLYGMSVPRPV